VFIHVGVPDGVGRYAPAAFDMNFSRELVPPDGSPPGTKRLRPSSFAMDICQIKRVHGCTYDPRQDSEDSFFTDGKATYFNLYNRASLPIEDPKNSAKAGEIFLGHLRVLVAEEEYVQILLQFFAFIVQQPGIKIRWMPCIQSAQGTGKGLLGSLMGAAIGEPNVGIVEGSTLFAGPWNDWAFGRQFIIINELRLPGHSREEGMNRLKTFITDPYIAKTEKYRNTMKAPNVANAIAFVNPHNALAPEKSERRWFVLKSPLQTHEQALELEKAGHFIQLKRLADKFGGALRHFLLGVDIPADSPVHGTAPITPYLDQMRDLAKPKGLIAVEEEVEDQCLVIEEDLASRLVHFTRNGHPVSHHLYSLGFVPLDNGRKRKISDRNVTIWTHINRFDPDLDDADTMAAYELEKSGKFI
jgi:hypothetical protein